MNWQVIKNRLYWLLRRTFLYSFYALAVFFVSSFILLQFSVVQTALTSRYLRNFNSVSGFQITYDRLFVKWFDRIEIEGLTVIDPQMNVMIEAERLQINFQLSTLSEKSNINLDAAALRGASVNLVTIPNSDSTKELNINLFVDQLNKQFGGSGGGGSSTKVNIGEIILDECSFSYNDTDQDSISKGFDYYHFRLGVADGEFEDFKVIGDTIQTDVKTLLATDQKTKLNVHDLQTFFLYCRTGMEFRNINLAVGKSIIRDTVLFSYESPAAFKDFNHKVNLMIRMKETILDPNDLALFGPGAEAIGKPIHLSGRATGTVNHFYYKQMAVAVGNTKFSGQLELDGLPVLDETFINVSLHQGRISMNDLHFLFSEEVYDHLRPFETFGVGGKFVGFVNDFVSTGRFETKIGNIRSDINLKIESGNVEQSTYSGNLALENFDLGKYLEDTTKYQKVTMTGKIEGKGLTEQTANFQLTGKIQSIGVLRYNYANISTDAQFAKQLFNGTVTIDDPNLKLTADGSIDFRKGHQMINIKANLDTARFQALNLTRRKIFLRSQVDIESHGLEIDSLFGDAFLRKTVFALEDDTLRLDTIHVNSSVQEHQRKLTLQSSLVNASLEGNYHYSTLFADLSTLVNEFYLNLRNDKKAIADHYLTKTKRIQSYDATFNVQLRNIGPIADLIDLDLGLSRNVTFKGKFSNGHTSILTAYSKIDSLLYENKLILNTELEVDASKVRDSAAVLASVTINSSRQEWSPVFKTTELLVETIWDGHHVDLDVDFDQEGLNNEVRLKSEIDFLLDSTKIKILPSRLKILEKEWSVSRQNYALVKGDEWLVHQLAFTHGNESILLDGRISREPAVPLLLTVDSLNLDIINTLSTEKFGGKLNGNIYLRDPYVNPSIQNDLTIKNFTVNNFLIGDVTGSNVWNQDDKRFNINFIIDRIGRRVLLVNGYYDPNEPVDPLHVQANLENIHVKVIEPFVRGIFSQIDGTLTGAYLITGTFRAPKIKGEGKISDGQITIDYLKTAYKFTGILAMSPGQVGFKDFALTDAFNNHGTMSGYISHREFSDMRINLDATFKNFQLLNTASKDNSLFYGQGYATGSLKIVGPLSNLKITATAKSQKNTKVYIPIHGTESVEKRDFIAFTHFTDSVAAKKAKNKTKEKVRVSGITLELNLDITPDAFVEIIFDLKAGDIIRGKGNGNIKLQLDTKGEFNMFGSVEFTEGAYNFTLYDIINKEFVINKGSRMSWFGDPYQGTLNITASYKQSTSFAPIIADQTVANDPNLRRKYPVDVVLKLDGPMLSPNINFDIDAPALPASVPLSAADKPPVQLQFEFTTFKAKLDEQELKKQVFSLIMLRRFSPYGESMSASGSVASSVSELFSNQLSYWLSQVDQNLEIDMDIKGMNQEAFNTFQLRLSYSFLNGRLRVTRDGTINNQTNNSSGLGGDWTVDYLLSPDGKFKVKMYSRSNYSTINSTLGTSQSNLTTGVSLLHTQNFNQLKDLLRAARNRKPEEEEKKEDAEKPNDSEGGK